MRRTASPEGQITPVSQLPWPLANPLPQRLVSLRGMAKSAVSPAELERAIQHVRRALKAR